MDTDRTVGRAGTRAPVSASDENGFRVRCEGVGHDFETSNDGIHTALEDIDFTIEPHEFICLVGPSGCGKTTLLRVLAGLLDPSHGTVAFDRDPDGEGPRAGLVFQEHGVFPWLTVLDNVAFGLEMQGVGKEERRSRSSAFIERVGLEAFADSYPRQLSIGMRQRVGIIRAFVTDPPLLLMDEPFGALDSQTRRVLQIELLRLWRAQRSTVVFVTHDIDEAVRLSDRVLVLTGRPGRIREEIPIPRARPRDLSQREPPEVNEIKWHIWTLLESDVRQNLGIVP